MPTFASLPLIDTVSGALLKDATGGQFRATAGGPVIDVTDLVGVPLTQLTSNSIGLTVPFIAPDPYQIGVVTFGTVAVPHISNEARDSGLKAEAARAAAVQASAQAAQAVLDASVALSAAQAAVAAAVAPSAAAVDAGIVRAGLITTAAAQLTFAVRSTDFVANRAYQVGELVVSAGVIYRRTAAGAPATFISSEWSAVSASGSANSVQVRRYVAGVWEARGSSATTLTVFWLKPLATDPDPPINATFFLQGTDVLLKASA